MDLYTKNAYQLSEKLTKNYSSSFSLSTSFFSKSTRVHIYAIYGLVRIVDEIVDSYRGKDSGGQLDDLFDDTMNAIRVGYSTNPIVHAFALTAREFGINKELIAPFFASMRMDLNRERLNQASYVRYIYGSAEVVGLMCLKVFVNDERAYKTLKPGAQALGSAYQKVNFLRDMKADYDELGRVYFPGVDYKEFNDEQKQQIVQGIEADFAASVESIQKLPSQARKAVTASFMYYQALFRLLKKANATEIKQERMRTSDIKKIWLYIKVRLGVESLKIG